MKETVEIEKTVNELKTHLVNSSDSIKLSLYWGLLKECMDKNCENVSYVGELWTKYLTKKINLIDQRKKDIKNNNQIDSKT